MGAVTSYQAIIERILKDYAAIPYSYGDNQQYVIIDLDRPHSLLFHEG